MLTNSLENTVLFKVGGPKGLKWTVLKVNGRLEVNGPSKSGRS